jgi:hypothetical protein
VDLEDGAREIFVRLVMPLHALPLESRMEREAERKAT